MAEEMCIKLFYEINRVTKCIQCTVQLSNLEVCPTLCPVQ